MSRADTHTHSHMYPLVLFLEVQLCPRVLKVHIVNGASRLHERHGRARLVEQVVPPDHHSANDSANVLFVNSITFPHSSQGVTLHSPAAHTHQRMAFSQSKSSAFVMQLIQPNPFSAYFSVMSAEHVDTQRLVPARRTLSPRRLHGDAQTQHLESIRSGMMSGGISVVPSAH